LVSSYVRAQLHVVLERGEMNTRATRLGCAQKLRTRKRARLSGAICVVAIAATLLPAIPAQAGQSSPPGEIKGVDLANAPYQLPAPPPVLTDEQRQPPVDLSGLDGLWPADVVPAIPGGDQSATELLDSATPLLAEGSANTDIYGYGENDADHFATAYTDVVNRE